MRESITRAFSGPYGILPTPFLPDGRVDLAQVEELAGALCQTGLSGLVVCGSTSEFVLLTPEENKAIMTAAARAVAGRKPLICGATAPDARTAKEYLAHMAGLGAAGALTAPPYYFPYGGEEVLAFYRELDRENFGVKIVAYQIPAFSSPIPLGKMEELLALPHVAGLKNSSADIKQIMHQLQLRDQSGREDFAVLTGTDDALVPCLCGGCDGSFTALAAVFPQTVCQLYRAVAQGDLAEARRCQAKLLPITRLADRLPFPVGYKLLSQAAGDFTTCYRQSLGPAASGEMGQLLGQMRELIEELGLR